MIALDPVMVAATVIACIDPTARISSADLVHTDATLLPSYTSFAGLGVSYDEFCQRVEGLPMDAALLRCQRARDGA